MPRVAQNIRDARDERGFGADDHQIDGVGLREGEYCGTIVDVQAHVAGDARGSSVAGGHEESLAKRGLGKEGADGVLAATTTQNQDVHVALLRFVGMHTTVQYMTSHARARTAIGELSGCRMAVGLRSYLPTVSPFRMTTFMGSTVTVSQTPSTM